MSTSKNKKEIKVHSDRIEELFKKYGLKTVYVEKTGCSAIISNRPIIKK